MESSRLCCFGIAISLYNSVDGNSDSLPNLHKLANYTRIYIYLVRSYVTLLFHLQIDYRTKGNITLKINSSSAALVAVIMRD